MSWQGVEKNITICSIISSHSGESILIVQIMLGALLETTGLDLLNVWVRLGARIIIDYVIHRGIESYDNAGDDKWVSMAIV